MNRNKMNIVSNALFMQTSIMIGYSLLEDVDKGKYRKEICTNFGRNSIKFQMRAELAQLVSSLLREGLSPVVGRLRVYAYMHRLGLTMMMMNTKVSNCVEIAFV